MYDAREVEYLLTSNRLKNVLYRINELEVYWYIVYNTNTLSAKHAVVEALSLIGIISLKMSDYCLPYNQHRFYVVWPQRIKRTTIYTDCAQQSQITLRTLREPCAFQNVNVHDNVPDIEMHHPRGWLGVLYSIVYTQQ